MLCFYLLFFCFSFVFGDLYNSSDPLVVLDVKNFYESVLGSETGWIIQFYNSWCGHCIHYAPKWREFSKEIKDWDHTFKVGAIDCSDEENVAICRDYEVMAYPSIRLFGAFTKKGDLGLHAQRTEGDKLQEEIVEFVIDKQNQNIGSALWKNLLEYNHSIADVFTNAPSEVKHAVLIVDQSDSKMGSETILDLGNYPEVYIRRIAADSKHLSEFSISSFPSVIVISRGGKKHLLPKIANSRQELTTLIMEKLELVAKGMKHGIGITSTDVNTWNGQEEGESPEEVDDARLHYDDSAPDSAYNSNVVKVYMVDLENAVSYTLRHEVALHKLITAEALHALKQFLTVLVDHFPARPPVHNFLRKLRDFVANTKDVLPVSSYETALSYAAASPSSALPDQQQWVGCQGSAPKYRGYPCALWSLFHTLTVNASLGPRQRGGPARDAQKGPLRAIHGYIKYFFSCEHCSRHFQEMYTLDAAETTVRSPREAVLWLFAAHNKVNERLKGELSEDPKHPKVQFPPREACPSCRGAKGAWVLDEVVGYLRGIYGGAALSLQGTQDLATQEPISWPTNRQAKVFNSVRDKFMGKQISDSDLEQAIKKANMSIWGLNGTDVSVCILLYVCSTLIIAAGYIMFLLKRRLRRKKFFDVYKRP